VLNKRQQDFAEYYIQSGNASEAARMAGYSDDTARYAANWLNPQKPTKYNPEISAYISGRLAEQQKKRIATADEVVSFFTSVLRGEPQGEEIPAVRDRMLAGRELLKRFDAAATEPGMIKKEDDPLTRALREEAAKMEAEDGGDRE
jgi:phage terminase small subunit